MNDHSDIGQLAFRWWQRELRDNGPGRMARAQLRRCTTPVEALSLPVTHALHADLDGALRGRADTLALIAVALANVRDYVGSGAAQLMGETVSAMRFQALIRTKEPAELIDPLRRVLNQIDNKANVGRLAGDLYFWNDRTRNSWCFEYYGAATADPAPHKDNEAEKLL